VSEPRATRILLPRHPGLRTELWVGGAHSAVGEPLCPADMDGAWVIDCANDMPAPYRDAAALWLFRVFSDIEEIPAAWPRISALTRSLALCLAGAVDGRDGWEHPYEPPSRLYVLCTQGLNRSGLIAGRILRELGLAGDEALDTQTTHRPGAMNNLTSARLVKT
jgi:hypothetical protein